MLKFNLSSQGSLYDSVLALGIALRWALSRLEKSEEIDGLYQEEYLKFFTEDFKKSIKEYGYDSIDDVILDLFDDEVFLDGVKELYEEYKDEGFSYEDMVLVALVGMAEEAGMAPLIILITLDKFDAEYTHDFSDVVLTKENFNEVISDVYEKVLKVLKDLRGEDDEE